MMIKTKNQLRCFCSRKPLLAVYGLNERGKIYIHVRIFKQTRIYGEVVVTDGTVKLHCRDCFRWHTVTIRKENIAALVETSDPLPV